jgi:hypothetical protein
VDPGPKKAINVRDYTEIEAWRLADDLTVAVYEATRGFPKEEMYELAAPGSRGIIEL